MRTWSPLLLLLAALLILPACGNSGDSVDPESLEETADIASFLIGYEAGRPIADRFGDDFVRQVGEDRLGLSEELMRAGFLAAMAGDTLPFSEERMQELAQAFGDSVLAARGRVAISNAAAAEEFLAANAEEDGVVTTDSGLQYKILEEGEGETPDSTSFVSVNYTGTLIDGEEFESTAEQGRPAVFRVDQVVAGMTEALLQMRPGARWMLYIPPGLAYGEDGGPAPNSALIFDLTLESISAEPPQPAGMQGLTPQQLQMLQQQMQGGQ